jgi:hypothetical protein
MISSDIIRMMNKGELAQFSPAICERYQNGESSWGLARIYGCAPPSIRGVLLRHGIKLRSQARALDTTVFNKPLSAEAAYWIGLLLADGCLSDRLKQRKDGTFARTIRLSLSLKHQDIEHIKKFRQFLKSDATIGTHDGWSSIGRDHSAQINVNASGFESRLRELGITPRKTATASAPSELLYSRDFWRGVIDGDGSVGITRNKPRTKRRNTKSRPDYYERPFITLGGTPQLIHQWAMFMRSVDPTILPVQRILSPTFTNLRIGGSKARLVIAHLYSDALISLERKQEIANRIIAAPPPRQQTKFSPEDVLAIRARRVQGDSAQEIRRAYEKKGINVTVQAIDRITTRRNWRHL